MIPIMDALHAGLHDRLHNGFIHRSVQNSVKRGLAALNKYYALTDQSLVARFALRKSTFYYIFFPDSTDCGSSLVLHPSYKTHYMQEQGWPSSWIEAALKLLRTRWRREYQPATKSTPSKRSRTRSLREQVLRLRLPPESLVQRACSNSALTLLRTPSAT